MTRKYIFLLGALVFWNLNPVLAQTKPSIKIGAPLHLTGNLATYGNLIRNGIQLAVEDLRAEGQPVEVVFEDIPLSGPAVLSGLQALLRSAKVEGIAGNFSNVAMASMAAEIGRVGIPTFHTAAADPLISESNDWVVTTNVRIGFEGAHIADYMFNKMNLKKVAVLSINVNFGQEYRNSFIKEFKRLGGEVISDETFEVDATEWKTQLTKIRAAKPQGIFLATFGNFTGFSLKQAKQLGVSGPFFSVYETEDQSVLDSAEGAAEGIYYFVTTSETSYEPYKKFKDRYLEKFGRVPGTFGSNAYDATRLLVTSLSGCNHDKACALKQIYETKNYQGVSGVLSIEKDGTSRKSFILRTIHGGKFMDADKVQ